MRKIDKLSYVEEIATFFASFCSADVAFFIGCQFALESNYGQSSLAFRHHNHCGMKEPHVRVTLSLPGTSSGFASYTSLMSCMIDYSLWLAYNKFTSLQLFKSELFKQRLVACGYCPEKDYVSLIQSIYENLQNYKQNEQVK